MRRVCIYCGSSFGNKPVFSQVAAEVGAKLAASGLGMVYGGGSVGLMGVVADAALARGGEVIGVIPRKLVDLEKEHRGVTQLIQVETMHERKQAMMDHADGFLVLPGGFGTLEELFEVLAWLQLGYHTKPVGLLNVAGYYDPLIKMLDNMLEHELLHPVHHGLLLVDQDVEALLGRMMDFMAPDVSKWL